MKLITRNTDYALRAICLIEKNKGKIISVTELVKKTGVPRPFLRKILQILTKKRILQSHKGAGGGFLLAKPAKKMYLMDLIRIFQGPLKLNECHLKRMPCPELNKCPLRSKINDIEKYMLKKMRPITIAYLLKGVRS